MTERSAGGWIECYNALDSEGTEAPASGGMLIGQPEAGSSAIMHSIVKEPKLLLRVGLPSGPT